MKLIIDAYNVLKAGKTRDTYVSENASRRFISLVHDYAALKKHEALIVFDGGASRRPERFCIQGVDVLYAGSQTTADQLIIEMLARMPADTVAVVSSDREICDFAQTRGILSIEASGFIGYMHEAIEAAHRRGGYMRDKNNKTTAVKLPGHESSPELDMLMEQCSARVPHKDDDEYGSVCAKRKSTKKLSKEERRVERLVKKLAPSTRTIIKKW